MANCDNCNVKLVEKPDGAFWCPVCGDDYVIQRPDVDEMEEASLSEYNQALYEMDHDL